MRTIKIALVLIGLLMQLAQLSSRPPGFCITFPTDLQAHPEELDVGIDG